MQTKILTLLIYPKLFAMSIIYQLLTNYLYSHFVIFNPIIIKLLLWFAFKLVSLNHWKQLAFTGHRTIRVVICFQISIFEPLKTALFKQLILCYKLWFAFKLVSLNHWKQPTRKKYVTKCVVICFQISIFEPLKTANI